VGPSRITSLEAAAAYVDQVGITVAWGKSDLVLPSLWQGIAGQEADWAVRDESGKATEFTPEFRQLWRWKDELPERRLACAGRHFNAAALLIAPRLLADAYALTGRAGAAEDFRDDPELEALEREVAEAVLENGPLIAPEIRRVLATDDRKAVERAIKRLQRRFVLTNAGAVEQSQGWSAISQDLFARRWKRYLRRRPEEGKARQSLVLAVLSGTDEVSAADVAGALGWRRKQAEAVLDELTSARRAESTTTDGIRLWCVLA
jgi:chromosome segregation and condensation protein ScpB